MNDSNLLVAASEPYAPLKAGDQPTLQLDKQGVIRQNHANLLFVLRNDAEWQSVVSFDEFSQVMWLDKPVPRHNGQYPNDFRRRQWTDADLAEAVEWFQLDDFSTISAEKVQMAVTQFANQNARFHPVRDFLKGLKWDHVARLDEWLITYGGAHPDTDEQRDYILTVGGKWMISGVARIMKPGCQADHVLIFEGKQGIGKSKALQVLGGDHFSDGLPDVHSKDARDHVRGKWIIEIAELSQMNKADVEAVKAFITRREERFRPAYGRNELVYPRQCIFAATTNRPEFLKDDTGNRRFWPVTVTKFDMPGLARDRDQLWAEAFERYNRGEAWHLTDQGIIETAEDEQSKRFLSDAWEYKVAEYLENKSKVMIGEVLQDALFIDNAKQGRIEQNRVIAIITGYGWKRGKRTNKGQPWVKA